MDFQTKLQFFIIFIILTEIQLCQMKSSDSQVDFVTKQYQKLLDKGKKCAMKKVSVRSLTHLRLTAENKTAVCHQLNIHVICKQSRTRQEISWIGPVFREDTNTIVCLLSALKEKEFQSSGMLWTALGTLFNDIGQGTQASTCFKHAVKLTGKVSPFISDWSFLGPFVIGKSELDGDPVESFGGITNIARFRYKKGVKFYSELVSGGEIEWTQLKQASESAGIQLNPSVNWNELVNSLGSMGIMEWQGWFVGELAVNEKEANVLVQCHGVHTVYIGSKPVTGDVYHRKQFWFGIKLRQGLHSVYVKLRTEAKGQFVCKFQSTKNSYAFLDPHFLPDLVSGHLFSGHFSVPVVNYQHTSFLKIPSVVLVDLISKTGNILNKLDISLIDSEVTLAPGQVGLVNMRLKSRSGETTIISRCSVPESHWDVKFSVKFTTSAGTVTLPVSIRCRHDRQSFLFSFEDHDGSIQHAAGIQPLKDCPVGICPVMMSLHGTSIPPQNQADSYKHMVGGEFLFGFDQAWTLAPTSWGKLMPNRSYRQTVQTLIRQILQELSDLGLHCLLMASTCVYMRHGAHNWEGPGSLTALTAVEKLEELSKQAGFFKNKADAHHVVFAGHSMGGHGAWHVATHYPDRALALVSLAGWIKKEEYGDDNLFFRHDIATSHVEPAVKAILESCAVENDVDQHVTNLHGVPIVTRIGAKDRTVHPLFARRMYRLMKEEGFSVNHTEVKDKEHWWWDTAETNDGGAVHDRYLRDFTNQHITSYIQSQQGSCSDGECTAVPEENKYTAGDMKFTLTCYNPAATEGMHGLRILLQITPHRKSQLQVQVLADKITVYTTNVQRISFLQSPNRNIHWENYHIKVDDSSDIVAEKDNGHFEICLSKGQWSVCDASSVVSRSIATMGPARRVAEQSFTLVIGTSGSTESQLYIQQSAVYIANLFFLTSDTRAVIRKDTDISTEELGSSNVIVIGNSSENLHTKTFMNSLPIEVLTDGIHLGRCKFSQPRSGVLTLAPNGPSQLALLLLGASQDGLQDVVSLAAPTIPPMTRSPFSNLIPDFVITGPSLGRKGPGGYLCTGFYDNHWQYRSDLSSCICA